MYLRRTFVKELCKINYVAFIEIIIVYKPLKEKKYKPVSLPVWRKKNIFWETELFPKGHIANVLED